jgi:hypothetical protein
VHNRYAYLGALEVHDAVATTMTAFDDGLARRNAFEKCIDSGLRNPCHLFLTAASCIR